MRKYNISANLVRTIEQLYDNATSAVKLNGSIGEWFRTTVGVRQKLQKLGTVTNFTYLGVVVSDDGSKPEVLSRIAQATAAHTKLNPIWRDDNISLGSKVKLICSLVISIFLYACESWILTAELEKRRQVF